MIELREISILDKNLKECIDLEVTPEQNRFVANNATSLADAYIWNKRGEWVSPNIIYADSVAVGFVMYQYLSCEIDEDYRDIYGGNVYCLWRIMIDKNYQGKGYGKQAIALVIDAVKKMPKGKADYLCLAYKPENVSAKKLYESLGFVETGEIVDDELLARFKL